MKRFFIKNEAEVYTSIGLLLILHHFLSNGFKFNGYPSGAFIFGLGASTKGNVLLQYCNLGGLIEEIGEVNPKNKKIVIEDKVVADCLEALIAAIYFTLLNVRGLRTCI